MESTDIIDRYRRCNKIGERMDIWFSLSQEQKLQYHMDSFRSKPEWQRLGDATYYTPPAVKWLVRLWLRTKWGRLRLENKERKFWMWILGDKK